MDVSLIYYTKFGNNAALASRLSERLESLGHTVQLFSVSEVQPDDIPDSDLYLVGSPTQVGTLPIKMSRFLGRIKPREGGHFAVFSTRAERESGAVGVIKSVLTEYGLKRLIPDLVISVKDLRGPMEEDWENKAEAWADSLNTKIQS